MGIEWGVAGWARVRPQNGDKPQLESRDEITGLCLLLSGDLKMVTNHDWSPKTRLQGCAYSLAVDM